MKDDGLAELAQRIGRVDGVVGVTLGGSRARGTHLESSDFDLGLYYRRPLDLEALRSLARSVAGPAAVLTDLGGWGPWVDGGGWLEIDSAPVDWLYRDLDRVQDEWQQAQDGRVHFHGQTGHPLGFPGFAYPGELALGRILADPTGQLRRLQLEMGRYPDRLSLALVDRLDQAGFLIEVAHKAVSRRDVTFIAGCLFAAVGICAHALHAKAGVWLINEKGSVEGAARLSIAPDDFADRANRLLSVIGSSEAELEATVGLAHDLLATTADACDKTLALRTIRRASGQN